MKNDSQVPGRLLERDDELVLELDTELLELDELENELELELLDRDDELKLLENDDKLELE